MAQKFIGLEEAAELLSISKDRLNELREAGKLRAYRDGTSWKFRSDEVTQMAEEGIPPTDSAASGLDLDLGLGLDEQSPVEPQPPSEPAEEATADAATDELAGDIDLAEEPAEVLSDEPAAEVLSDEPVEPLAAASELELDLADDLASAAPASDLGMEDIDEPTVPADLAEEDISDLEGEAAEDLELSVGEDEADDDQSESILMSEAELGTTTDRPPSTIIGKVDLDTEGDLELLAPAEEEGEEVLGAAPDSDVLTSAPGGDVLDLEPPSASGSFQDLEELEVDLEAESSRILSPQEIAKVEQEAEGISIAGSESSGLELAPSDSSSPGKDASAVDLGGAEGSDSVNLSGLSALELDEDEDDEQVLGEGSDITLSSESSGINIVSPSDSGLALDDAALELSGTGALGSSLDLGGAEEADVDLQPLDVGSGVEAGGDEEPFTLTPIGEEGAEEEEDSSQVIALDEVAEEEFGAPVLGVEAEEAGVLTEDFGAMGLPGAGYAAAEPAVETPFSLANILSLACCLLLLTVCLMMTYDLLRNMWSWQGVTTFNSWVLQILNPFLS